MTTQETTAITNLKQEASNIGGDDGVTLLDACNDYANAATNMDKGHEINVMIFIYDKHVSQRFYDNLIVLCDTVNPNGPKPSEPH